MSIENWFTKHKIYNVSGLDPHQLMERYPNHTLNDLTAEYRHAKFQSRQSGLGYLWVRIGDITLHVRDECEECGKYTIHLPYHLRWLYAVLADYGIMAQEANLCYLCMEVYGKRKRSNALYRCKGVDDGSHNTREI